MNAAILFPATAKVTVRKRPPTSRTVATPSFFPSFLLSHMEQASNKASRTRKMDKVR